MLPISRKPGQKVYIGDNPVTLISATKETAIVDFQDTRFYLTQGVTVNLYEPEMFNDKAQKTTVIFSKKRGNYILLLFSSKLPIFREEVYNKRKLSCGKVQQSTESPSQ